MVVMIAIQNSNGEFLMQKRVPSKGGDWGVTGGHPKSGETPREGIITEVQEELGLNIENCDIEEFDYGCDGKDCYIMYYTKLDVDISTLKIQLEELFRDKDIEPKRWANYRPLWYKYYDGKMLEDNSFGQLEKKLIK